MFERYDEKLERNSMTEEEIKLSDRIKEIGSFDRLFDEFYDVVVNLGDLNDNIKLYETYFIPFVADKFAVIYCREKTKLNEQVERFEKQFMEKFRDSVVPYDVYGFDSYLIENLKES